jgi:hypothetical protein
MSFKINDKVIFTWNYSNFPGEIVEVLEYINIYNCKKYKVKFPPNSYAGSVTNPREILGYYLKLDLNYENSNNITNNITNNQRFDIEI